MNFLKLKHLWSYQFKHKDIFSSISGHEDIKWLLNSALSTNSEQPVHILLVGKPGLAKTKFLEAIEREYGEDTYMALGSGTTGQGMVKACFEKQPRYLLVDEIEDLKQSDQAALLSLMQSGVLVETKVKSTRSIKFKCSIIATCNDTKRLRAPLVSRFMVFEMGGYSQGEFVRVAVEQLKKRGLEEDFAWFIAQEVWKLPDPNIRECLQLSNLCQTEDDVIKMLGILK